MNNELQQAPAPVLGLRDEIPPKRSTLFDLGIEGQKLEARLSNALFESEGAVTPEVEEIIDTFLRDNQDATVAKLDGIGALLAEWDARAEALRKEARRLAERAQVTENQIARLKNRVMVYLELVGKEKVETPRYKFSVARNGGKAPVLIDEGTDPADAHSDFQKPEFDKDAIRKYLEAGGTLHWAQLGERGKSLRVK